MTGGLTGSRQLSINELAYLSAVGLAFAAALALELNTSFWKDWLIPFFGVFSFLLLVGLGTLLRVPGRWIGSTAFAYGAALMLLWALPLNPIERFVRAVGELRVGMTEGEVDKLMAGQVKGARLDRGDGVSQVPEQPYAGQTYYEPQGHEHSFDRCCLVSWQDGRASYIEVHLD
jgi:hypothetical protein